MTLIPIRTHAGIGGKCPNIIIKWSSDLKLATTSGGDTTSLDVDPNVQMQTGAGSSVEVYVDFRNANNIVYEVHIEAGTCMWHAPTVSCTITRDDSNGNLFVNIDQGDYTDQKDANVFIDLAD